MSVHKKLMQARIELGQRELKKSGHNKFAGYNYFELGDFLPTGQKIFADLGLCGIVSFTADTATLTITDTEGGGEIVITSPMGSANLKGCHEVQNVGAVETYQRRYLWVTAFEIVEHDALDSITGSEEGKPGKKVIEYKGRPTDGAWEAVDAETQAALLKLAADVIDTMAEEGEVAAFHLVEKQGLDSDEKAALWTQLDSKTRSALKRAHKAANEQPQEKAA